MLWDGLFFFFFLLLHQDWLTPALNQGVPAALPLKSHWVVVFRELGILNNTVYMIIHLQTTVEVTMSCAEWAAGDCGSGNISVYELCNSSKTQSMRLRGHKERNFKNTLSKPGFNRQKVFSLLYSRKWVSVKQKRKVGEKEKNFPNRKTQNTLTLFWLTGKKTNN